MGKHTAVLRLGGIVQSSSQPFTRRPGGFVLSLRRPLGSGSIRIFSPKVVRLSLSHWQRLGHSSGRSTPQTVGVFSYGGGVDFPVVKHVSLRAEYRGLVYNAPDFGLSV